MPTTVCICVSMCFVTRGPRVGRSREKNPTKIISSVADTLFTNHCDIYIGPLQEIVPCLDNCTLGINRASCRIEQRNISRSLIHKMHDLSHLTILDCNLKVCEKDCENNLIQRKKQTQ